MVGRWVRIAHKRLANGKRCAKVLAAVRFSRSAELAAFNTPGGSSWVRRLEPRVASDVDPSDMPVDATAMLAARNRVKCCGRQNRY